MVVPLEQFVKQLEDSGILAGGTFKNLISPNGPATDAEELAQELVRHKMLTEFQVQHFVEGRATGLIIGGYTLLDKIGEGGMGQVFKAQHRRMDRIVAIKMLPPSICKNPAAVSRFEREARVAAKLLHPNIVTAFDANQADGIHFLVMQYVEGQDLSALVKKSGPLRFDKAVNYILQAARGLEFAHKMDVVHRDIKPANLLLDLEGQIKILDMGLARIETSGPIAVQAELTDSGAVIGTVDYMSPEQAFNTKHADARADIYSLGCSLYYLMTGKATFAGETVIERILAHREKPIPSLRDAQPDVPIEIEVIFRKMLAKKVEARYQSMADVVAALERSIAVSVSSQAKPPSSSTSFDDDALALLLDEDALAFLEQNPARQKTRTKTSKKKTPPTKEDERKKNRSDSDGGKATTGRGSNSRAIAKTEQPPEIQVASRGRLFTPFRLIIVAIIVIAGLTAWGLWQRSRVNSAKAHVLASSEAGFKALKEGDFATAARELKRARDAVDLLHRTDQEANTIRRACSEAIAGNELSTTSLFQLLEEFVAETRQDGSSRRFDSKHKGTWLLFDSIVVISEKNGSLCFLDMPIIINGVTFQIEIDSASVKKTVKRADGATRGRVIFAAQLDQIQMESGSVSKAVLSLNGKSAFLWSDFQTYSALGSPETDAADIQSTRDLLADQLEQIDG